LLNTICYKLSHFILRFLVIIFLGYRARGQNNVPLKGGGILASNHQSFLDPVLIAMGTSRPIYFLAKQELFSANWLFGLFITLHNAVPLNREATSSDIIRKAIGLLKEGKLIVVFPEGTRTNNGRVKEFKGGISFLSQKSNTPIIPIYISGAYNIWPRQASLPVRLSSVRLDYTKPVYPDSAMPSDAVLGKVRGQITSLEKLK